jgi:transcriptional regulator with XRE-family HTH domain
MDEAQLRNQLGRTIAVHRRGRGLTQEQLAEAVGVSTEWVSQLERGVGLPSLDGLLRLAEALGTDAPAMLAAALGTRRREAVDELVAEVATMADDAVEVLVIAAKALRGRWPRGPGAS